ncbi:hypothetical protein [Microbacterium sp. ZXX196]|uniref:hypothetical protein n=1 Tax=Microbacterium sp. ZXX196 TaxID=2609291 RepID=UPI0012B9A1AC|nr:hypothetical protein [Microbacterium sp. ZXX196]MTE24070.1 hypothetical protein [Microbacterium sp. ZXX196]
MRNLLLGSVVVIILGLAGCATPAGPSAQASATPETSPSGSPVAAPSRSATADPVDAGAIEPAAVDSRGIPEEWPIAVPDVDADFTEVWTDDTGALARIILFTPQATLADAETWIESVAAEWGVEWTRPFEGHVEAVLGAVGQEYDMHASAGEYSDGMYFVLRTRAAWEHVLGVPLRAEALPAGWDAPLPAGDLTLRAWWTVRAAGDRSSSYVATFQVSDQREIYDLGAWAHSLDSWSVVEEDVTDTSYTGKLQRGDGATYEVDAHGYTDSSWPSLRFTPGA